MSENKLDKLLERQRILEMSVAKVISKTADDAQNSILKLFLDRLSLDSLKHADMIQALMDLRNGVLVSIVHKQRMQQAVEYHVAREKEMLRRLNEIVPLVHEPKFKSLLKHISDDEKKHHEILKEVQKILSWRDAVQEKWWNAIDRPEWLF